jgi:hypothetical protein
VFAGVLKSVHDGTRGDVEPLGDLADRGPSFVKPPIDFSLLGGHSASWGAASSFFGFLGHERSGFWLSSKFAGTDVGAALIVGGGGEHHAADAVAVVAQFGEFLGKFGVFLDFALAVDGNFRFVGRPGIQAIGKRLAAIVALTGKIGGIVRASIEAIFRPGGRTGETGQVLAEELDFFAEFCMVGADGLDVSIQGLLFSPLVVRLLCRCFFGFKYYICII